MDMLSDNVSTSSADFIQMDPPWKSKAFEYRLKNGFHYGATKRFNDPIVSRAIARKKRYADASKLYFQQSSIERKTNGDYTILNAVGEVDFHSSSESLRNDKTDENVDSLQNATQRIQKLSDELVRISAGKDEPKSTEKEPADNDAKITHSTEAPQVPQCTELVEVAAPPKIQKPKRKQISASKRQKLMLKEYKKMTRSLSFLVKRQKPIPLKKKVERSFRKELLGQVRRSLKVLRKKLEKREKLYQFEVKKRLHNENRKRVRSRLRKILRVVYSKRKQRIRSMRDVRIRERKRIAENLMLKAAQLRSRANRLTAGRETRFLYRQVQLPKNPGEPLKIIKKRHTSPAAKKDLAKTTENVASSNVIEKKTNEKKKPKKLTKRQKQKKKIDYEVKAMGARIKGLLNQFSSFCKPSARRKAEKILAKTAKSKSTKDLNVDLIKNGSQTEQKTKTPEKPTSSKKKSQKDKKKRKRRHLREAWWRKDKLKAAKILPKEIPIINGFGSDTALYNLKIVDENKPVTPRPSKITAVKSFS